MSRQIPFISLATILVVLTKRPLIILSLTNQIAITLIADGVNPDYVRRACRVAANEVWQNEIEGLYDNDNTLIEADLIFRISLYIAIYNEE